MTIPPWMREFNKSVSWVRCFSMKNPPDIFLIWLGFIWLKRLYMIVVTCKADVICRARLSRKTTKAPVRGTIFIWEKWGKSFVALLWKSTRVHKFTVLGMFWVFLWEITRFHVKKIEGWSTKKSRKKAMTIVTLFVALVNFRVDSIRTRHVLIHSQFKRESSPPSICRNSAAREHVFSFRVPEI